MVDVDSTYGHLTLPITTTLSEVLVKHIEKEVGALRYKAGDGSREGEAPESPVKVMGDH